MINLKHAHFWIRIPVRKRIESCSKKNVLRHASRDSMGKHVFGIPAASNKKSTQPNRKRPVRPRRSPPQLLPISLTKNRNSDRILKNQWRRIVKLVRRTAKRNAKSGSRWLGLIHVSSKRVLRY